MAIPRLHSFFSLPGGRVRRQGLELVTRWLQPGSSRGNDRISQVPGKPQMSVCACSKPMPAGPLTPDHYGAAAWPLVLEWQRLLRKVFRRSIAWLSDSLHTLRVRVAPPHAMLASGRWSGATGRAFHPQGSDERFQSCYYISSSLPELSWRNRGDRRAQRAS